MSVNSEIQRISSAVADAYDAVDDMGGTLPSSQVVANLANAIKTIPQGGGSAITVTEEEDVHGGTIKHITAVDLSADTVTADHLETGYTAHDRFGNPVVGRMSPGTWSYLGRNPVKVKTCATKHYSFSSLGVGEWTWSSSSTTLMASQVWDNEYVSGDLANYDYILVYSAYTYYAYTNSVPSGAIRATSYFGTYGYFGGFSTSLNAVKTETPSSVTNSSTGKKLYYYGYAASGGGPMGVGENSADGVQTLMVSTDGQGTYPNYTFNAKAPSINVNGGSRYSQTVHDAIDLSNSYINMSCEIWRVDAGTNLYSHVVRESAHLLNSGI